MEKITFCADDGVNAEFYVLEQTTVGGINYILVTDREEGDGEALILKDLSAPDADNAEYEIVSDDEELKSLSDIFENLLEGVEIN